MMEPLTVLVIAMALAMDCFAVSLAAGTVINERRLLAAAVIGIFFGFFQTAMAFIGWAAGSWIATMIGFIDHWIAFAILAIIGGKMIIEGFRSDDEPGFFSLAIPTLLVLSVATSIDSLGVGLSFALLSTGIVSAAAIIGIVSFMVSFAGVMFGSRLAVRFGRPVEIAGGIVLIIIGIRILFEHLFM